MHQSRAAFCLHILLATSLLYIITAQKRTDFIQALLVEYDSRIPPNFEKNDPCDVNVSLYINSIDSISEQTMDFTLGTFVRQQWRDSRLRFLNLIPEDYLELDARLMENVWVPDLYISNEKKAYFHSVTFPNKMLHLYQDGSINYRSRITLTATCPMKLHKYPMDKQICSLYIRSFAYSMNRLSFNWRDEDAVQVNPDMTLPQFTLDHYDTTNCSSISGEGNFTCIQLDLYLRRNIGYYMIQLYVPSMLVVLLSWLSFWLHVEAVPARISLGILTVLTITTQRSMANASLPRVSYIKAIDVWMAVCLCFVFAALLEYAVVNVLSRNQKDRQEMQKQMADLTDDDVEAAGKLINGKEEIPQPKVRHLKPALPNNAQTVDALSRLLFPVIFLVFCCFYWALYITIED